MRRRSRVRLIIGTGWTKSGLFVSFGALQQDSGPPASNTGGNYCGQASASPELITLDVWCDSRARKSRKPERGQQRKGITLGLQRTG